MKFKVTLNDMDLRYSSEAAVVRFNELGTEVFGDPFTLTIWSELGSGDRWIRRTRDNAAFAILVEGELPDSPAAQELVTLLNALARGEVARLYPDAP